MRPRLLAAVLCLGLVLAACAEETSDVDFGDGAAEEGSSRGIAVGEPHPDAPGGAPGGQDPTEPAEQPSDPDEPVAHEVPTTAEPEPPVQQAPATAEPSRPQGGAASPTAAPAPTDDGADPDASPAGYTSPRPGQADVQPRQWESAEVQADGVTVVVTWYSGPEPCNVLDRVELREEPDRVVITLYEGHEPGFDGACMAVAEEKRTKVTLSAPLADRPIADGAREEA